MKNYNENDIRVAAYFNWLNSGCQNGNDLQNWNLALQQLANNATLSKNGSKASNKASACKTIAAKAGSKTITTKAAAIKTISKTSASKKKK